MSAIVGNFLKRWGENCTENLIEEGIKSQKQNKGGISPSKYANPGRLRGMFSGR
jgi:hypothetical protein